jgi:hypothetical protein
MSILLPISCSVTNMYPSIPGAVTYWGCKEMDIQNTAPEIVKTSHGLDI